jgi:2-amino-4-hydroxy-6-hydroxymethyldihydropteridine diphosphokinase
VMAKVGFSLGTNLGDRLAHLQRACTNLRELASSDHFRVSNIYETDPVDCPEASPGFLNAVIEIETAILPLDLLGRTQSIETDFGRPDKSNRELNAPRVIDVDILYYGDRIINEPTLIIPHPRMHERDFVLRPLSDIRLDLVSKDYVFDKGATKQFADSTSLASSPHSS